MQFLAEWRHIYLAYLVTNSNNSLTSALQQMGPMKTQSASALAILAALQAGPLLYNSWNGRSRPSVRLRTLLAGHSILECGIE